MSNSLASDQANHFVWPDLGPNFCKRLLADDKRCHRIAGNELRVMHKSFPLQKLGKL